MYGKLMSIPDDAMGQYYRLLLDKSRDEEAELVADIAADRLHPKDAKSALAKQVVSFYHGAKAADAAAAEFERVFAEGKLPSDIPEVVIPCDKRDADGNIRIVDLLTAAGFASSNGEARRLIRQGAVRLDDRLISDETLELSISGGEILQVGKRRIGRLAVERYR